jgi:hypothetical protein
LDLDSSPDEPPSTPISADVVPVLPADPQPDPEPELPIPTGRSTQVCGPLGLFRCTEVLVGEEIHTQYEPIDRHGKSRGSVREAHEPLEAVTDWLFKSRQVA